jgi:hypothetical protein
VEFQAAVPRQMISTRSTDRQSSPGTEVVGQAQAMADVIHKGAVEAAPTESAET